MPVQLFILMLVVILGGSAALLLGAEVMARVRRMYAHGEDRHWDLLGDRVRLLHGHNSCGDHVLDGHRSGVWLHVEAQGSWMVIRGRIEAAMPARFGVAHRGLGAAPGVIVGSPILDGLVDVSGDPSAAAVLQDPDLTAALLAVIHAWPRSTIDERYVTLRSPDAMGRQLEDRCQEVIALVEALRVAARKAPERLKSSAPR